MIDKFAFLITTFDQVDNVLFQIESIRKNFTSLNNNKIIIISSDQNFDLKISDDKNIYIESPDFIGNTELSKINNADDYKTWKTSFQVKRILSQIQYGVNIAYNENISYCLHYHSDTFLSPYFENTLIKEIELLNDFAMISCLSEDCENQKTLPFGIHLHTELIHLNLKKCHEIGYCFKFDNIFLDDKFKSHNYNSISALFGQYMHYCLTGKNILKYTDPVSDYYYKNVRPRSIRPAHGMFNFGVYNSPIPQ